KLATTYMPPRVVFVFSILGSLLVVFLTLISLKFSLEGNAKGVLFALLAGLSGSAGGLFFLYSVSKGKASVVITMTALYPVITIILSFLVLRETITVKQGVGIIMALISMLLLSR
ncbi:MAG: EamA family transporter, partial [Nitrospirota bacterium]